MVTWAAAKTFFTPDGALRDIYAFGTNIGDWQLLLDWIRQAPLRYTFTIESQPAALPAKVEAVFAITQHHPVVLSFHPSFGVVNCHFFSLGQIELDLFPNDISSDQQWRQLLDLIEQVATAIGKPLTLAQENWPEAKLLTYHPLTETYEEFTYEGL